jgi:hypothetical protein
VAGELGDRRRHVGDALDFEGVRVRQAQELVRAGPGLDVAGVRPGERGDGRREALGGGRVVLAQLGPQLLGVLVGVARDLGLDRRGGVGDDARLVGPRRGDLVQPGELPPRARDLRLGVAERALSGLGGVQLLRRSFRMKVSAARG